MRISLLPAVAWLAAACDADFVAHIQLRTSLYYETCEGNDNVTHRAVVDVPAFCTVRLEQPQGSFPVIERCLDNQMGLRLTGTCELQPDQSIEASMVLEALTSCVGKDEQPLQYDIAIEPGFVDEVLAIELRGPFFDDGSLCGAPASFPLERGLGGISLSGTHIGSLPTMAR